MSRLFQLEIYPLGFWFRIFGCGLAIGKDRPVLFSERYGYQKVFRLGRWSVHALKPYRL